MPSPNANPTPITPPRVPLVDPRTGYIDRAWYLFFLSLNNAAIASTDNVDYGPSPVSLIASYDAALQELTHNVNTQQSSVALLPQLAEMQKQIDALTLLPAQITAMLAQLADVTAMNPSDGDKLIYNGATGKWNQDSRSYLMLE
jgi:hypothetical protein